MKESTALGLNSSTVAIVLLRVLVQHHSQNCESRGLQYGAQP